MAGDGGRGCSSNQTVAVIFVLCSLAVSSTGFSLQGLSNEAEQDKVGSEATEVEVKMGSILFNGKILQSGSASATATENDKPHTYSVQPDSMEFMEQPSLLEDNISNGAAWQHLNPSLHCSQMAMKFTAFGSGADDLQLDMGNADPLPLQQVPDSCGYSVQQTALGLILEVSYDGCNVVQEDGNYTLPIIWRETPVELICAVSINSAASPPALTTTTPKSPAMPEKLPFRPHPMTRRKRHTSQPLPMNDPRSPYYAYWYYWFYLNRLTATTTATPTTTTTTTKPPETTATTKPPTVKPQPVKLPVYPYYPHPYYPYYHYYPLPQPLISPAKPATTTAKPTTSMPTTSATTTKPSIKNPPKPGHPVYLPYPYPPHILPPGKPLPEIPENSEIYYYPVIQHFYGKPPVMPTVKPGGPTTPTSKPSAPTSKPSAPTSKPEEPGPTTKPSAPTAKPTTAATTPAVQTTPSSGKYPGPMSPFVPYNQDPFQLYVQYKAKNAGKLPFDPKFMPHAAFKSGAQPRAHLHPGFNYWQPGPWFPESAGQGNPPFDWKNFQPKEN